MVIVIAPLFWAFMYAREYFRRSARETQRLVAITASPIFSSLEETLDGLATIRAYAATGTVVDTFGERMRLNSSFQPAPAGTSVVTNIVAANRTGAI